MMMGGDLLGGFFEKFKSPAKFIESAIAAPSVVPVGATVKIITKTPQILRGLLIGAGTVGAAALFLGGKGSQEQKAAIDAPIIQQPSAKQDVTQSARAVSKMLTYLRDIRQRQDVTVTPSIDSSSTTTYKDISAGGDIDIGGVTNITRTATTTYAGQGVDLSPLQSAVAENKNILDQLTAAASQPAIVQEQKQEGNNLMMLVGLGIAAVVAITYFKRGKK